MKPSSQSCRGLVNIAFKIVGKEEIEDFPVGQTILDKLGQMVQDIGWVQTHTRNVEESGQVLNQSFFECESYLAPQSVDLIITSPPYLNNYHYNRNTRPQLYWLRYVERPADLKRFEHANFGKYWQTVREKERVALEFKLAESDSADAGYETEAHPVLNVFISHFQSNSSTGAG